MPKTLTKEDAKKILYDKFIPSLDLLEKRLRDGMSLSWQDVEEVWLLSPPIGKNDKVHCHGETLRELLINLVWVDC